MNEEKKERKMRIVRAAVFVGIFFGALFLISFLINNFYVKGNPNVTGRQRCVAGLMNEPEETLDVIALGDSEAYTSINPMYFWKEGGVPLYLVGQPGQHIGETYFALRKAFATQSPKVVLIETHCLIGKDSMAENIGKVVKGELKNLFSIFVYHDKWKQVLMGEEKADDNYFKGYEIMTTVNAYGGEDYMDDDNTGSRTEIPPESRYFMGRILDLCKRNGAKIVFYSSPSPVNYNPDVVDALTSYAKEIDVPYYDFNTRLEETGIDWSTDTLDNGDHVNLSGSIKISGKLLPFLNEIVPLEDRSNDPSYSSWNELLKKYEKMVAEMTAGGK